MEKTKMPMTATQAQQLYVAYFNRPADTLGLAYWMTKDAAAASAAFAASTEYAATYAGMSTAARVDAIYTNLFGRPSEPDGLKFWGGLIESGKITVSDAVTAIAKGAQGTDLTAYNNKVKAAEAFTTALDTSAEIVGYSGTAANNAAKAWLSGVTTDATLTTATTTAALNASIATATAPVVAAPVVSTLTVSGTAGKFDNLVGGSGVDQFQALGFGTLEDGDVVNGAGGDDVLTARFDASAAGATTLTITPNLTSVEKLYVGIAKNDDAGDRINVDTTLASGLKSILVSGDASAAAGDNLYTFNNLLSGVKVGASGGAVAYDITGSYKTTSGAADSEGVLLEDKAAVNILTVAGIETVNVEGSGTINVLTAAAMTKLVLGGTSAATVKDLSNSTVLKTIDASLSSGGVTVGATASSINDAVTSVTGGSGNDTFIFTANRIVATDKIDGGLGSDTVNLIGGGLGAEHAVVVGFETLAISDAGTTYDLSKLTGSTITQVNAATTGGNVNINNVVAEKVSLTGDAAGTVTITAKTAASSVDVTLDNGTGKNADGVDVTTLTATSNITTMNINSNDSNSSLTTTNTNSAGGIATATVNVAATAATALTFTGTTTKIINGASSTGALTIDAAAAFADSTTKVGVSITTGSGKDTISALTAQNDTVNTGAGNDTISDLAAGDDTINLGDGDDTLSIAAANFANLTSADKIDGGLGVDSLSVTAANGGTYSFKGANAANLSGVTGIERFELNVTALTGTQTAAMQFDDATMSVAGNALTLVAKPNSTAVAGVVAVLDTSAVVLSSGTVTLDASTFGSILGYVGGNAKETITGGTQADVFTYSTSAYLAGTDVIKGGTGADVLVLSEVAAKTITAAQLVGVSSVGTINLDGVDGNNTAAIKITLSAAVATAMAESDALTVRSINASAAVDDTGKITVDGSTVGSDVALTLTGALGIDTLSGGAGADQISGGAAKDVLTGNGGKDTFNFVATATATTDTIKDFDAGTSTTTVDTFKVTLAAATWATGATIITASSGAAANDSRVVLLDTASYANLAAAEDAAAALHTADGNADYLFIWQDSLGNVHVSYDGDQATDAAGTEAAGTTGLLDLAILQGVTITGLAANLNYADFTFA